MNFRKISFDLSFEEIDKNQFWDTKNMLSLLITHLNQGIFVKMIFYPSEKIGTEKFSTMLEQFELEKPHHA